MERLEEAQDGCFQQIYLILAEYIAMYSLEPSRHTQLNCFQMPGNAVAVCNSQETIMGMLTNY